VKDFWQLSPETVLRAEKETLLWFHRGSSEMLELDSEGNSTLGRALAGQKARGLRARFFLHYLRCRDFLRVGSYQDLNSLKSFTAKLESQRALQSPLRAYAAPEALHLSLTDRCDQRCAGCFFSHQDQKMPSRLMDEAVFQRVLAEAVEHRVFQIALGGGEPLLHPRLVEMVRAIRQAGILPSLTSNGNPLTEKLAQDLKQAGLGQFQISLNGLREAIHRQTRPNHARALAAIQVCRQTGLRWGLNVLVTRQNLTELEPLFKFAQTQGAWSVNLLRPKPALQGGDWLEKTLTTAEENRALQKVLRRWQKKSRFLLTTDSSFAFLREGHLKAWQASGVQGCSAGRQILSIGVEGGVSPCSHVPYAETSTSFMQVWQQSAILERFRSLEDQLQGACQRCELKSVCRGCRAIVLAQTGAFEGADPGCPKRLSIFS